MAERDPEAVRRSVERFASALVDAGVPRMPARVFAALQTADSGRLTSAEISELLQVSPAAISGAVRYLTQVHLIRREREPGSRRDHYAVDNEIWYEAILDRNRILMSWERSFREGMEALGPSSPAAVRLAESMAFFEFVRAELPALMDRWRKVKEELRAAGEL